MTGKNIEIPNWIKTSLDSDGIKKIIAEIQLAETKTDVEFVPLIVKQCVPFFSLIVLIIRLLFIVILILSFELFVKNLWLTWQMQILAFGVLITLGYFISIPIAKSTIVTKSLISGFDIDLLLQRRATVEFYTNKMDKTFSRTVVLIMISVLERKAIILADPTLNLKTDSKIWQKSINLLIDDVKNKKIADGFCKAIHQLSLDLSLIVPPTKHQKNEFEDMVLIKEY